MALQPSDIIAVYSGGSDNSQQEFSLGGDPSVHKVVFSKNSLFGKISGRDAISGTTDYRCIYLFNESMTDPYLTGSLYTIGITGPTDIQLGCLFADDEQKIEILGNPTSGYFLLAYDGTQGTDIVRINFSQDTGQLASQISTALNRNPSLGGITVTGDYSAGKRVFVVTFSGVSGSRHHPILRISANGLDSSTINITKTNDGSPINAIANVNPSGLIPPAKVSFFQHIFKNPDGCWHSLSRRRISFVDKTSVQASEW